MSQDDDQPDEREAQDGQGALDERPFEECLQALEKVVERIESGELNLEESLATFEEGVRLVQSCNRKLGDVERRIEVLTKDSEGRSRLRELVEEED